MSGPHSAAVFNQSEADFARSAERIKWEGPESILNLGNFMKEQAPGLYTHLGFFKRDVLIPFVRDHATKQIDEAGRANVGAFDAGAVMAFKMVDGVFRDTGAELPDLREGDLRPANPDEIDFKADATKKVIDLFFRGPELRDRLPHVYHPSFTLMHQVLMDPAEQLEADMSVPLTEHRNFYTALAELHFMGGVAETVLAIEDHAAEGSAEAAT